MRHGWSARGMAALALAGGLLTGCSQPAPPAPVTEQVAPKDAQHQGITEPHGDHSAHHGGMVLMNGEVHYEVVLDPAGRYELWLSDAVRTELPASIASNVTVTVSRPNAEPEMLRRAVDDAGRILAALGAAGRELQRGLVRRRDHRAHARPR